MEASIEDSIYGTTTATALSALQEIGGNVKFFFWMGPRKHLA